MRAMTFNFTMLAGVAFVLSNLPDGVDKQEAVQVVRVLAWSIGLGILYFALGTFLSSWGVNDEVMTPSSDDTRKSRWFRRVLVSIEMFARLLATACIVFFLLGGVAFILVLLSIT